MAKLSRKSAGNGAVKSSVATHEPGPDDIEIEGAEGVERVVFHWPRETGGIVEMQGPNGCGKSTVIRALDAAHGRKVKLRKRDGAAGGHVKGFGVTVRIGETMRVAGECDLPTLEDRLNISELIDGNGIEDPVAADRARLKALLRVRGDTADSDVWYDLLGDEATFRSVVPRDVLDETDLVKLAANIKRVLDAKALEAEREAAACRSAAAGKRESVSDVDPNAPTDHKALQAAYDAAVRKEATLNLRAKSAAEQANARVTCQRMLAEAQEKYDGPSVETARAEFDSSNSSYREQLSVVSDLEAKLQAAVTESGVRKNAMVLCRQRLEAAENHDRMLAGWRATIDATPASTISETDLQAATLAVTEAREAVEYAGVVKRARQIIEEAESLESAAGAHERAGQQLRQAAKGTDQVLTDLVRDAGGAFIVGEDDKGRMRIFTDDPKGIRGVVPYSELSPGEKARLAIPVAIEAVGEGGGFTLDQEIWEGLDPDNRRQILQMLLEARVVMATGQVSTGKLRAVVIDNLST